MIDDTIMIDTINSILADTHTACIAKITAVSGSTISAQPVVARIVDDQEIPLPIFTQIPVFTLQGGGSYLAMPIAVGDDCMLIFNERCLDNWWSGQNNVKPLEERMHDYSDGIAFVGVNAQGGAISIPSVITQMGDAYAEGEHEYLGNHEYTGDHVYNGDMTVNGNYTINGNLKVTGVISAGGFSGLDGGDMKTDSNIVTTKGISAAEDVKAGDISLQRHTHGGVEAGGGSTGEPQ